MISCIQRARADNELKMRRLLLDDNDTIRRNLVRNSKLFLDTLVSRVKLFYVKAIGVFEAIYSSLMGRNKKSVDAITAYALHTMKIYYIQFDKSGRYFYGKKHV